MEDQVSEVCSSTYHNSRTYHMPNNSLQPFTCIHKSFILPSSGFYLFYINLKPAALSSPSLDHGAAVNLTQNAPWLGEAHTQAAFSSPGCWHPLPQGRAAPPGASFLEGAAPPDFPLPNHHHLPWGPELVPRSNHQSSPAHTKLSGTGSYRHTPTAYRPSHLSACAAFEKSRVFRKTSHKMQSP